MNSGAINALLIEDNAGDVRLIQEALNTVPGVPVAMRVADRLASGLELIGQGGIDVILLDLNLPDGTGLPTVHRALAQATHIPIVILTLSQDHAVALRAIQAGAQDYLFKDELNGLLLTRALHYAIERHRLVSTIKTLSLSDPLTNLPNRRGFVAIAEHLLKMALHQRNEVRLIIAQLRNARTIAASTSVNVLHTAMIAITAALKDATNPTDLLGNLGEYHFAVFLVRPQASGLEIAEANIRTALVDTTKQMQAACGLAFNWGTATHDGVASIYTLIAAAELNAHGEQ